MNTTRKTVCVIGGGVSGMITLKVFMNEPDTFDVTVFEQTSNIGGVWSPERAYVNLTMDSIKHTYGFVDMPVPDSFDEYPTAQQMQTYFQAFAEKFHLMDRIQLNTKVIKVEEVGSGKEYKWKVTTQQKGKEQKERMFDLLVVATGLMYVPFIPQIENADRWKGKVYHNYEVINKSMLKDKRVLVVGSGKSAADIATVSAKEGESVHMVFRKAHWLLPRESKSLVVNRLADNSRILATIAPYYDLGWKEQFFQTTFKFLVNWMYRHIEDKSIKDLRLENNPIFKPDKDSHAYLDPSVGTAPYNFYERIFKGEITGAKTTIKRFVPDSNTVEFEDGTSADYDIVVMGTGSTQEFPFFSEEMREKLGVPTKSHPGHTDRPFTLYRNIAPVRERRNIGFVGFMVVDCAATVSEVMAHWLTEYFLGHLELPSLDEMKETCNRYVKYEKEHYEVHNPTGFVDFFPHHQTETLLSDMKLNNPQTTNFFSEYFMPVYPSRYKNLQRDKELRRVNSVMPLRPFYFSFWHFMFLFCMLLWALFM